MPRRPSGRAPPPTPEQVARVRALLAVLYPPPLWTSPPLGSSAELARRVGCSPCTVRRLLAGQRGVSAGMLERWEAVIREVRLTPETIF